MIGKYKVRLNMAAQGAISGCLAVAVLGMPTGPGFTPATILDLLALGLLVFLGGFLGGPLGRGVIGTLYVIIIGAMTLIVGGVFNAELFGTIQHSGLWTLVPPYSWEQGLVIGIAVGGALGASYGVLKGCFSRNRTRNYLANQNVLEFLRGLEETDSAASVANEDEAAAIQPATKCAGTEFLPVGVSTPLQAVSDDGSECVSQVPTTTATVEHHDSHPLSQPARSNVRSRSPKNPVSSIF
jgi:hypothetical protein